jgi:broad specificity phosphatase PhoE
VTVLHLVRHGQVDNPQKIVYGRQRGWRLSDRGRQEAEAVARHLGGRPITRVYTSPLERAVQTATVIAGACGGEVEPRDDLVEALLCTPWGVAEDLRALAARMDTALRAIAATHPGQQVVTVSHGDPLKAGILALTGGDLRELHKSPIPTGGLVSLEMDGPGPARVRERWVPGRE